MNGANAFGRIITEQMRAHSDPIVKKLGDYMAPMYQVSVKVSPEGAAEATSINAYYPKGMTVMLKTIPKSGKKFLGWYDGNGNKVGAPSRSNVKSPYIHTFVMGSASTQFTAVYEGGTAQKYTGDGAALTAFPTTTPKSLDDVTFVPFTPIEGSTQDTVKLTRVSRNSLMQALRIRLESAGLRTNGLALRAKAITIWIIRMPRLPHIRSSSQAQAM